MKALLEDIATIATGIYAKPEKDGDVVYLQVRHFDENGNLSSDLHPDLNINDIAERHLLKPGDILFSSKGSKNFAAMYESHNPPCVASTSFFVLRLTNPAVKPEYLVWFLNHPSTIKELQSAAMGTSMPSISKAMLDKLDVTFPSIEKQSQIVELSLLSKKEKALQKKIIELKEKYIQAMLLLAASQ